MDFQNRSVCCVCVVCVFFGIIIFLFHSTDHLRDVNTRSATCTYKQSRTRDLRPVYSVYSSARAVAALRILVTAVPF